MSEPQSNQLNGAEAFVRMLQGHGVKHIFGLCGDTTLPIYDALQNRTFSIYLLQIKAKRSV